MNWSQREKILTDLGVREAVFPLLRKYMALLWQANESMNLISRKMTEDELMDNHIVDSFLPLVYFPEESFKKNSPGVPHTISKVADFGSGGGMPGVLYALQFPEITFRLFEKSPRKQEFLRECQRLLAPNIEVVGEITAKSLIDIDLVIARAFKPLDVILELSREYYSSGGTYFLLKGRQEKIYEEERLAQKKFKTLQLELVPLRSPVLDVERHLILVKNNSKATP